MNLIQQEKGDALAVAEQLRFDYTQLDKGIRAEAKENTLVIFQAIGQAGQAVYDIGLTLIQQKDLLDHGMFEKWLTEELGWKPRRAELYMSIPQRFPRRTGYDPLADLRDRDIKALPGDAVVYEEIAGLPLSTQQVLAAPSVPVEKVREVIEVVKERQAEGKPAPSVREIKTLVTPIKQNTVRYVSSSGPAEPAAPPPPPAPSFVPPPPTKCKVTYVSTQEDDSRDIVRQRLETVLGDMLAMVQQHLAGNSMEYWWRQYLLTGDRSPQCELEQWAVLEATLRSMKRCVQDRSFGA